MRIIRRDPPGITFSRASRPSVSGRSGNTLNLILGFFTINTDQHLNPSDTVSWESRRTPSISHQRGLLATRHELPAKVWDTIDMTAFGRNLKAIPLNHQAVHLKFIHNQVPLGDRLYQRSPVKDPHLKLCPLCKEQEENIHHFLHCHKNPNCEKSIKLMVKTILKDDHPSRPAFASCLEQYLQSPGQPIQFHNKKFPGHLDATLHEAIEEQTLIGSHHLLLGYTSKKWLLLASMGTPKLGQIIYRQDAAERKWHLEP
jgi:hypothetical protein